MYVVVTFNANHTASVLIWLWYYQLIWSFKISNYSVLNRVNMNSSTVHGDCEFDSRSNNRIDGKKTFPTPQSSRSTQQLNSRKRLNKGQMWTSKMWKMSNVKLQMKYTKSFLWIFNFNLKALVYVCTYVCSMQWRGHVKYESMGQILVNKEAGNPNQNVSEIWFLLRFTEV